jgi:hypothetical protein
VPRCDSSTPTRSLLAHAARGIIPDVSFPIMISSLFIRILPNQRLLAGGGLASLELLKVPVANLHVSVVVVHALCKVLGDTGAVVLVPGLLLRSGLSLDGSGGLGGTTEQTTNGVAY